MPALGIDATGKAWPADQVERFKVGTDLLTRRTGPRSPSAAGDLHTLASVEAVSVPALAVTTMGKPLAF